MATLVASPQRILFARTDRLGEVLLSLPAVLAIRAACPKAQLIVMVQPELKTLLDGLPEIDRCIEYQAPEVSPWWVRAMRLAGRLRAEHIDLAIISNPKKELHAAAWLAGIPLRVGYDRKWGFLLTHRLQDRKALGERHEVEYNLDLVKALGLPANVPEWRLPRFEREQHEVLQLLEQQNIRVSGSFIVVHPWASNPIKRWPTDRYQQLIRLAVTRLSAQIVIIGGPEETDQVSTALPANVAGANLAGRLTLLQLAALLQRARLLVSNDSGPVHLAAAAGTPALVLFGSRDPATGPRRWGPWGRGHRVIWKESMEAITVDEVFSALQEQLQTHPATDPDHQSVWDR